MNASDAKQGMFVRATRDSAINGHVYEAGEIGYVANIIDGSPRVRRVRDDAMLGPVSMQNWEPYEPAQPVPVIPGSEFVAGNANCPWCGAEWRAMGRSTKPTVRWACDSYTANGKTEQSISCKANVSAAVTTLASLRALLLAPGSLASMKRDLRLQVLDILKPNNPRDEAADA